MASATKSEFPDSPLVQTPLDSHANAQAAFLKSGEELTYDDTTIIFDWDDTLLSSSWLATNNLRLDEPVNVPLEACEHLDLLADSVINLLTRAKKFGRVIVITNAETGWVQLSCKKFMPRVLPFLGSLRILSARSSFEARFPESPSDWKIQAFHQEITAAYAHRRSDSHRNVISFGDSIHERLAIQKVTGGFGPSCKTKSIKFVERPTVEQLKRQVDLVTNCFEEIARHNGSLDLMLTIQLLYPGQGMVAGESH